MGTVLLLILAADPHDTLIADVLKHVATDKEQAPARKRRDNRTRVLADIEGFDRQVTPSLVPRGWLVVDLDGLQQTADSLGETVLYLFLSGITIADRVATLTVGSSYVFPKGSRPNLGGCNFQDTYELRKDGHWHFVRHEVTVCA
jgi:hypothetical protein